MQTQTSRMGMLFLLMIRNIMMRATCNLIFPPFSLVYFFLFFVTSHLSWYCIVFNTCMYSSSFEISHMSLGFSGPIFRSGLFEYTPRRAYTFFIIGLRYVILPV